MEQLLGGVRPSEHAIGPVAQIPKGEGRNFFVGGVKVAVFRTAAGELYATQPECPHRNGPLADGLLGGSTVVCPLHDRAYDLRTGEELDADCRLTTYPIRLDERGEMRITL